MVLVLKNLLANPGDSSFYPWVRKIPWRRKWQPVPAFMSERSLVGYSLWGHKELDMTDQLHFTFTRKGAILISFRQENCLKGGRDSYRESLLCLLNF